MQLVFHILELTLASHYQTSFVLSLWLSLSCSRRHTYTYPESQNWAKLFSLEACFIGVCFTSDSGTRNGNFSFHYISASRTHTYTHIRSYTQFAAHMHNMWREVGWRTASKWKINKDLCGLKSKGNGSIHSNKYTNNRAIKQTNKLKQGNGKNNNSNSNRTRTRTRNRQNDWISHKC